MQLLLLLLLLTLSPLSPKRRHLCLEQILAAAMVVIWQLSLTGSIRTSRVKGLGFILECQINEVEFR
jgi:hypothetical protein